MSKRNLGMIVSLSGSVVDVRFDTNLPPLNALLRTGADNEIIIEVVEQLDARHLRGFALPPRPQMMHGMPVEDTGGRFCQAQPSGDKAAVFDFSVEFALPRTTRDTQDAAGYI